MADAVASQTILDGERLAVLRFTSVSDGTGESNVVKVDVSALAANSAGKACSEEFDGVNSRPPTPPATHRPPAQAQGGGHDDRTRAQRALRT